MRVKIYTKDGYEMAEMPEPAVPDLQQETARAAEEERWRKLSEINAIKEELAESDYKAIKYAEGWLTEDEYAPVKAHRQALRDKINELEAELASDDNNDNV